MDQILAVTEAAITVLQLSWAVLRRNMLLHDRPIEQSAPEHARSVQRRVYVVRKELTQKKLGGFAIDDSCGALTIFAEQNSWSEMVRKHNDPSYSYHLRLFDFLCDRELVVCGT